MTWDEENRLMGINDNGRIHQYTYDAAGERVIKSSGDSQNVAVNGQTAATIVHTDDYTGYVSPYFVINKGKFTKHYFEGAGRIVSKLGNGTFAQPLGVTAGGVNYTQLTAEQQKSLDNYVKSLGVPPGPPTQQGIYATPEFTGDPYPSETLKPVEENQEPPEGWPRNPVFNAPGDVPEPPVQFGPPVEPTTVKAGEGFTGIGLPENDIFYFHPDHLGSTSYISTKNGTISQHIEYIAFGEVLFEEHSSSFSSPYLFNGKELDRETNLSYYGARYLDMKTSLWLSVDPLVEKYSQVSPYTYCFNNPINAIDPDGRDVIFLVWASHDGKIGHAGVAVSNYTQISERVKVNGKWKTQTKMVADGTYTYRDLWPGGAGAGKDNFDKNVPAVYNNKIVTLNEIMKTDVTQSEGYIADGIVRVMTSQTQDETLMMNLDAFEKANPSYNGMSWNCSDFVEEAMEWTAGKQMPVDEKLTKNKSATTPNKIFKAAKSMPNSTVLKNPGTKVDSGFIQAVTGGGTKQKIAEKKLD